MRTVLKICCSEWENASRDKRELSVYRELGDRVLIMAKGKPTHCGRYDNVDGFDVIRLSTRPLGNKVPVLVNRVLSAFTWALRARKVEASVISGHDLLGVLIGYLSNIGLKKSRKAKLIYDSHEFELGRAKKRSRFEVFLIKHLERFLMKRCVLSIVVNDSIADELQQIHGLKYRPTVVRSTPHNWKLDRNAIEATRVRICNTMGIPNDMFLVMYHGAIAPERSIEVLVEAVSRNQDIAAVILGNASSRSYLDELQRRAEELGITNRILFHPAVSIKDLYKYVGAADLGIVLASGTYKSYYLSLPNKFFENIQALTPIIAPAFPEMKRLVEKYGIGLVVDLGNDSEVDAAIQKMRTDKDYYVQCKANLQLAKQELCWENEKNVLVSAYEGLFK